MFACRHVSVATRRIIDLPAHDVGWSAQASACVGYHTNAHKLDVGMSCPRMLMVAGSQALCPDAGLGMPALCACARGSIISLGVPGQWRLMPTSFQLASRKVPRFMTIDTCEEFNMLPTQFWLSKVVRVWVCALSLFPCRHASGVRTLPQGGRLQPHVWQSRQFYGLGRMPWSAHCTTDTQMRCNGLRAPLTQLNKISRMSWHRPWRRCISATGRRRSRPLVTVAMQHCRHVLTVATQHNQWG